MVATIEVGFMHDAVPVQIRFQLNELAVIDAYRRMQANPPSRPQAIRELLKDVLSARPGAVSPEAHA
jgi:hypothetical protein